jgi:hypothetical protein
MTIASATKKLEKNGFNVSNLHGCAFEATRDFSRYVIRFQKNGQADEVVCIKVVSKGESDNAMIDYFPGTYVDNVTRAMRLVS